MTGSLSVGHIAITTAIARHLAVAVVVLAGGTIPNRHLGAQVIRGTARAAGTERPLERARIVAMKEDGRTVGAVVTNDSGYFYLKVEAKGEPFVIAITRIGLKPTVSSTMYLAPKDTLDVDFSVAEEGIVTDTVKVTAAPSLNDVRLKEADRRGWRVFHPADIEKIRDRTQSFEDLLRSTGYPGLVVGRREECIRNTRTNKCLLIVVDGVPLSGTNPLINPRDVYFMALLSPNQSQVQFGDRAPNGALVVYTRSHGDSYGRRPPE